MLLKLLCEFFILVFCPFHISSNDEAPFDPQNLSMYYYMNRYNAESSFASVDSTCPGFVCEQSGLSEINIKLLLYEENKIRNTFASVDSISNMYAVKWNPDFARMARSKVMLCLPPTTIDQTIYDTKLLKELPYFQNLNDTKTVKALEVVIGLKVQEIGNEIVQNIYTDMKNKMSDFLNENYFNHRDALVRRGGTLFMGCDYMLRNNGTHVLSNVVCIYGPLYFIHDYHNAYKAVRGSACSECAHFYDRHPALTTNANLTRKWACDLIFTYLCKDTFDFSPTSEPSYLYPCSGEPPEPLTGQVTFAFITIPEDSEYDFTPIPDYKWPCYQLTVPIVLLTLIVLVILIYNLLTALSLRASLRNKYNV